MSLSCGGPEAVITYLGVYRFSKTTGEMYLDALQTGVSIEEVRASTGWKIKTAKHVGVIEPPAEEDVNLLRSLDPRKVYLR